MLEELKEHIRVFKLQHRLGIRARTGEDSVPGHALFQWMLRHAAWSHSRFQPQSHRGGTPWEIRTGTCYKSPLLPFMEACMIRVPINPPGLRRKLDVQWMKRIWVERLDESDGHVVLTPHGTVTGRSVRRLARNLRVQADLVEKIKSRVQDPALSQAELLKVLHLCPSGYLGRPTQINWQRNRTELHRVSKWKASGQGRDHETAPFNRRRRRCGSEETAAWRTTGYDP